MQEFSYLSAFIIGLMGGVHCIGMCGGIVSVLGVNINHPKKSTPFSFYRLLLVYNLGRLFSYTLAGGLMGSVAWMASHWLDIRDLQIVLQFFAASFMLMLGLYLSGWWMGLMHVEKLGGFFWKKIEPLGKRILPVDNINKAFSLGLLWGWLPCGLVYSVLIWALSAGNFKQGALIMLSFGLGTLPNLLAMGIFARQLNVWVKKAALRQSAGLIVMAFALWNFVLVYRSLAA